MVDLTAFLRDGKLTALPSKRKKRLAALSWLADHIPPEREYTEREFGGLLNELHTFGDPAALRRELYDAALIDRSPDGSGYRLNPGRPSWEELLARYDPDGLELDFLRFSRHLTPGKEREQAPLMTEFVRSVRMAANAAGKARGRRIALSARVPEWRTAARAFGLDVAAWVREGLVDEVVPCNMWAASNFDLRIDEWTRELAGLNPSVRVTPGTDFSVNGESGTQNLMDYAAYCGWADCMYARGAAEVYLFNVSYLAPETRRALYEKGLDAVTVARCRRRYPLTFHDGVPEGMDGGKVLPANDRTNCSFRVFCGRAFPAREVTVVLGLTRAENEFAVKEVLLNGNMTEQLPEQAKSVSGYGVKGRTKSVWRYRFPASALRAGTNVVTTCGMLQVARINWCEIEVEP